MKSTNAPTKKQITTQGKADAIPDAFWSCCQKFIVIQDLFHRVSKATDSSTAALFDGGIANRANQFGVRRQSEAATALWIESGSIRAQMQSGVALRLPPHSKK
jgi:hypothetical protein